MSEVAQLEKQLEDAKELARRRQAALRLAENRDFRELILDDYLVKEAARCIQASGDPLLDDKVRRDMIEMAKATGFLKRFLSMITTMGGTAEADIVPLEEAIVEARQYENQPLDGGDLENESQTRGGVLA